MTAALRRAWAKDLDVATLYALLKLRVEVFVVEQACPYPELDGRDLLAETRHFWLEAPDREVICTLRLMEEHAGGHKVFRLGRLCTKRSARGEGHTTRLLRAALAEVGDYPCRINAQVYLADMYAQHGFVRDGDDFLDDGVPHVPMLRPGFHPPQAGAPPASSPDGPGFHPHQEADVTTPESPYLVGLRLAGKKVVVVGGGSVAQRRLPLLVASGADVHVISRSATRSVEAMGGITLSLRDYRDGDLTGAWYAIAATDDAQVNEAIVAEADRDRIFCVRADIAIDGSAVTPASFEYAGLSVGVLAGGEHRRSAGIRSAIREALQQGVISPESFESNDVVRGGVALIGGGPGDPELITVRGRRLLAQADVVVADRLAPPELLAELAPNVEVIDAAKIPYGRAMAQDAINAVMIERARAGHFVVRLKGGDPFVFARGYEEVLACVEAGIPVTVVPGVTSAIAVPASAGVPVTHRAINHEFVVVSGHLAPDHPESLVNWDALAAMTGTIVLLMAVERIELFAEVLLKGGRPADTPVVVVQQGTTAAEHTLRATLADAPEKIRSEGIRPPAIVVIGSVAAFGI